MTNHSQIKIELAKLIRADEDVRAFCVSHFGRGAQVIVDWFGAEGAPGVKQSPFIFLYSANENDTGFVDEETFDIHIVVGGAARADSPHRDTMHARDENQNGLIVNGIASELEELRGLVEAVVLAGGYGAQPRTLTREESSTADWPLEWAKLNVSLFEPETI